MLIEEITEQEIQVEPENVNVIVNDDYEPLKNKPSINNVELVDNKSLKDLGIDQDFVKDENYVHTDNNYTNEEKQKLSTLENYDDTQVKVDISDLQTNKAEKSEIPDVSNFITKDVNNLTNYTLSVDTGHSIELNVNSSTYVMTLNLKNSAGTTISTGTVDLPLESVVVSGNYDSTNKKIVLTLQNGNTIDIPVGDLVSGLQSEITINNKLSSDLVDDTNSTNKFVTSSEKQVWNNKSDFSGSYTDLTDKPTIPIVNVNDVQIDGTTIVSDGVANIPIASNSSSTGGLVKLGNGIYGIKVISSGVIGISKPTDAEIEAQTSGWRVLTPAQLSKAVKEGVTNNSITLTDTEKASARNWIGVDGNNWEKLVDKTLQADSTTALAYTDYAYEGKFKKIRIQIRGTVDINNANISFYRANSTTAYQVFGNVAKNTDTLYEFELEGKPYLQPTAIRDSSVELKVYNVASNTWTMLYQGRAPVASTMDNITDLKITSNGNFQTGTRVVVWGLK